MSQTNGAGNGQLQWYVSQVYGLGGGHSQVQSAIIAIISGALLAGSTRIEVFLVFRFFAGASAFMSLAAVPVGKLVKIANDLLTEVRSG